VIDRGEEFAHVTLQDPSRSCIILRGLAGEVPKAIHGSVRSLIQSARIGIENEFRIEVRIQNAIDGMMQQPVAHARLMDITRFRIRDVEGLIR